MNYPTLIEAKPVLVRQEVNRVMTNQPKSAPTDRATAGPLDITEVRRPITVIDLGCMQVPVRDDIAVKLEVEESSNRPLAVTLDAGGWQLQLQAFAAPKSSGIWHEIRGQIAAGIQGSGGQVEERIGSLGPELVAKMDVKDSTGKSIGVRMARFIGVDGPRWFLRGLVSGAALTDPRSAADADDLFRQIVVRRDEVPVPPMELLEIRIPGQV